MGQGAYIFGCEGLRLTSDERRFFAGCQPFGFILFARNIDNPDQLRALTAELRDSVGWKAPIFIDQEGGRVDRFNPDHWPQTMPALDQVECAGAQAERSMWLRSRLIAEQLHDVGIDANCVPVCDIVTEHTHPVLKNRCYGWDAATVTRIARTVADATLAGGVLPVVKHIPGYGRAKNDAHLKISVVDAAADELKRVDFEPFRALAELPMAMTAHLIYTTLDERPATLSPVIVEQIRSRIGFGGLIMGDDISMEALDGDLAERAAASVAAGCEIVLHCNAELAEMQQVADTVGMMTPISQARADAAMAWRKMPVPFDAQRARAELAGILESRANA